MVIDDTLKAALDAYYEQYGARKRRFQPNCFFGGVRIAGAFLFWFWVAGHDIHVFFAGFALLRRSDPLQNQKLGIFATFCDCGLLSAPLGPKRPFCCVLGLRIAFWRHATIPNRKKLQSEPIFCFLGSWKVTRCSAGMLWTRCRARGGSSTGGVDSMQRQGIAQMQRQGIAQPRRLGAVRVPC